VRVGKTEFLWAVVDTEKNIYHDSFQKTKEVCQTLFAEITGKTWEECVSEDRVYCMRFEIIAARQVDDTGEELGKPKHTHSRKMKMLDSGAVKRGRLEDMKFEYRGYTIAPKLDEEGRDAWLNDTDEYKRGFITVTRNGKNAMPGAIWFHTVPEAKHGIDALVESNGNVDLFFEKYGVLQKMALADDFERATQELSEVTTPVFEEEPGIYVTPSEEFVPLPAGRIEPVMSPPDLRVVKGNNA